MVDFSHLKNYSLDENKTAEYTFTEIKSQPTLICAPATPDNKSFFNDALKKAKSVNSNKSVSLLKIEKNREEDKELLAKHIIKGWKGVIDSSGTDVPFNKENVVSFLKALPDWLFDNFRGWVSTPENFLSDELDRDSLKN